MERRDFYLPDDMVIRILSRLSVRSLMRFRCVCKSWNAFIKDPNFISMHLNNYTRSDDSIVHLVVGPIDNVTDTYAPIFSLLSIDKHNLHTPLSSHQFDLSPFLNGSDFGNYLTIFGCCDGIVCLYGLNPDRIALWNPALRQFRILPESDVPRPPNSRVRSASVGLGFDSVSKDYKLVQIVHCHINYVTSYQVEIYSLKTNRWRKVDINVPPNITNFAWSSACKNNTMICWWAVEKGRGGVILSFDVSNQVLLTTPLHSWAFRDIVAFDNSFALIAITPSGDLVHHDIWVLNEFGVDKSWTKLLSIDYSLSKPCKPVGFWKDGEFLVFTGSGQLAFYSHATGGCKYLGIPGRRPSTNVLAYKESLVSINERNVFHE